MKTLENEKTLDRICNPNSPATIHDFQEIGNCAERIVTQVSGLVNSVNSTMLQIKEISAQVELEQARINQAIDALMIKAQKDIHIYEKSLPVLDKQFERCQDRMDKLMDKTMELISNNLSDSSLQRQEAMMSLIEITNNSLNSLIGKLIPRY